MREKEKKEYRKEEAKREKEWVKMKVRKECKKKKTKSDGMWSDIDYKRSTENTFL